MSVNEPEEMVTEVTEDDLTTDYFDHDSPVDLGQGIIEAEYTNQEAEPQQLQAVESPAPFFFDLETIPDYARSHLFFAQKPEPIPRLADGEMDDVAEVVAMPIEQAKALMLARCPSNGWLDMLEAKEKKGKKRSGMLQAIGSVRRALNSDAEAEEEWIKNLSVTPEYCRIIAMGWKVGDGPVQSMVEGVDDDSELKILRQFWMLVAHHSPVVGFNINHFDLPVIFVRSALYQLQGVRLLDRRLGSKQVKDLYQIRFPRGHRRGVEPGGLKQQAAMLGISVPAGDMDGSKVHDLFYREPERIHDYVQSDVWVLYEYWKRLQNLFW